MESAGGAKNPANAPVPSPTPTAEQRDFLLHLESYLARRDGVDKLLKISRYAAKIALSSGAPLPPSLAPRLRAFDSSVGLSRKAFRLGKFVQDLNAFRAATGGASPAFGILLAALAYGGEGVYYFAEQLVWLAKSGLLSLPQERARALQKLSAWAELLGYAGSVAIKSREVSSFHSALRLADCGEQRAKLEEKLFMKKLSIVQDIADGLMAVGDVRDGKGFLTDPLIMASAGMVSALISTHKNWTSC